MSFWVGGGGVVMVGFENEQVFDAFVKCVCVYVFVVFVCIFFF